MNELPPSLNLRTFTRLKHGEPGIVIETDLAGKVVRTEEDPAFPYHGDFAGWSWGMTYPQFLALARAGASENEMILATREFCK